MSRATPDSQVQLLPGHLEGMMSIVGQKVWMVLHTYEYGVQTDLFATRERAEAHAAAIALDYARDPLNRESSARLAAAESAMARGAHRAVLEIIDVPVLDDRCNLELHEAEIQ